MGLTVIANQQGILAMEYYSLGSLGLHATQMLPVHRLSVLQALSLDFLASLPTTLAHMGNQALAWL